jgi:hypothetical protein
MPTFKINLPLPFGIYSSKAVTPFMIDADPGKPCTTCRNAPEPRRYSVTGGSMKTARIAAAALIAIALAFAGAIATTQSAAANEPATTNVTHDI